MVLFQVFFLRFLCSADCVPEYVLACVPAGVCVSPAWHASCYYYIGGVIFFYIYIKDLAHFKTDKQRGKMPHARKHGRVHNLEVHKQGRIVDFIGLFMFYQKERGEKKGISK